MLNTKSDLAGKVSVVTGASGLIGMEVVRTLLGRGSVVVANCLNGVGKLNALYKELGIKEDQLLIVQKDLHHPNSPEELVKLCLQTYKRIDILVASAGTTLRKSFLVTSNKECESLIHLNFTSAVQLSRLVLRPMIRSGSGRIIFLGSRAGDHGLSGQSIYSATKGALHSLTKSLAGEVGRNNITVNVVAPGAVEDPESLVYTKEDRDTIINQIGLRRLASATEIANVVGFISSPDSSYINGATIPVDGGAKF